MPKVSVIIPVYGVEKYIERCVRSLFEQTLDDIEYIFVDDATKDKSIEILKRVSEDFPQRQSQIIILHHESNLGLPHARKTGIMHAKGDYIAHCDSDDWVDKDIYRSLYETAVNDGADIVVCDYYKVRTGSTHAQKGCRTTEQEKFIEDLIYKKSSWAVWNKLYNRSLYTPEIHFPACSMGEDMVMVIQMACRAKKISYIPKSMYFYSINSSSMVRTKTVDSSLAGYQQQKKNTDIVLRTLSEHGKEKLILRCRHFLLYLNSINMTPLAYRDNYCLTKWRECCPSLGIKFYLNRKIAFRHKFKYIRLSALHFCKIKLGSFSNNKI